MSGTREDSTQAMVRVLGVRALLTLAPDIAECARRRAVGLVAVTDLELLDVLMGLPHGLPVAEGCLTRRETKVLRRAPHGVLTRIGGCVERSVVAPVRVRAALVAVPNWRSGLRAAGRFAPFCTRTMHLPTTPTDLDDAVSAARFYGIGIHTDDRGDLLPPEPHRPQRHTPAGWGFLETVYQQTRTQL
ncbi:helix-turn-helix domain-containing protein [Nocardia bovistercoris]|uniref:hypothetical protein n=1 Tax=Nocardia bovistercoris TaxID=2785916 RepID=UPI001E474593|nr:hypothetical protein [Nocardia bovistercoris]